MPRLLILALLLYIAWRLLRNLFAERGRRGRLPAQEAAAEDVLMEDPVCHTLIPKQQAVRLRQDGKTHYFCSEACCDQFTARNQRSS